MKAASSSKDAPLTPPLAHLQALDKAVAFVLIDQPLYLLLLHHYYCFDQHLTIAADHSDSTVAFLQRQQRSVAGAEALPLVPELTQKKREGNWRCHRQFCF